MSSKKEKTSSDKKSEKKNYPRSRAAMNYNRLNYVSKNFFTPAKKSDRKVLPEKKVKVEKKSEDHEVVIISESRKQKTEEKDKEIDFNIPDRSKGDFFCRLCQSHMNNLSVWQSHVSGKRHLKNMEKGPQGIPSKLKFETVDHQPMILERLNKITLPVVGLDHVSEFRRTNASDPTYSCFLCQGTQPLSQFTAHLLTTKHRLNYISQVDKEGDQMITGLQLKGDALDNIVSERAAMLESKHGRGTIEVRVEKKGEKEFYPKPLPKISPLPSEQSRIKQVLHRNNSPQRWSPCHDRRSPSPKYERRNSPLQKPYRSPSPQFRRNLSPYRRLSPSPHRRRSPSPYRRRSPSPYRRRSASPHRRRSPSPQFKRLSSPYSYRKRSHSPEFKSDSYGKRSPSPYHRRNSSPYSTSQQKRSPSPFYGRSISSESYKDVAERRNLKIEDELYSKKEPSASSDSYVLRNPIENINSSMHTYAPAYGTGNYGNTFDPINHTYRREYLESASYGPLPPPIQNVHGTVFSTPQDPPVQNVHGTVFSTPQDPPAQNVHGTVFSTPQDPPVLPPLHPHFMAAMSRFQMPQAVPVAPATSYNITPGISATTPTYGTPNSPASSVTTNVSSFSQSNPSVSQSVLNTRNSALSSSTNVPPLDPSKFSENHIFNYIDLCRLASFWQPEEKPFSERLQNTSSYEKLFILHALMKSYDFKTSQDIIFVLDLFPILNKKNLNFSNTYNAAGNQRDIIFKQNVQEHHNKMQDPTKMLMNAVEAILPQSTRNKSNASEIDNRRWMSNPQTSTHEERHPSRNQQDIWSHLSPPASRDQAKYNEREFVIKSKQDDRKNQSKNSSASMISEHPLRQYFHNYDSDENDDKDPHSTSKPTAYNKVNYFDSRYK